MNKINELIQDFIETEKRFKSSMSEHEEEKKFLIERYEKNIIEKIKNNIPQGKINDNNYEIELISDKNNKFTIDNYDCELIKKYAINELKFNPNSKCSVQKIEEKVIYKIRLSNN